jgi:hypothetical protein
MKVRQMCRIVEVMFVEALRRKEDLLSQKEHQIRG